MLAKTDRIKDKSKLTSAPPFCFQYRGGNFYIISYIEQKAMENCHYRYFKSVNMNCETNRNRKNGICPYHVQLMSMSHPFQMKKSYDITIIGNQREVIIL